MPAPGITRTRRPFLMPLWVGALVLVASAMLLFAAFKIGAHWLGQTTTVIVLRHAEKSSADGDPSLSAAGLERSARLEVMLRDSGISAIYVSDTRRARETAAPLASRLGLPLAEYPARAVDALATSILARHRGERVLVVGHSNTVPQLLATLSGGRYSIRIGDDEFDGLYLVTVNRFDPPSVLRLRY